jgi:hypothetical protein
MLHPLAKYCCYKYVIFLILPERCLLYCLFIKKLPSCLIIAPKTKHPTANLGVKLDLKQIALRCRNTEYNPKRFGAVIMRLREPRATALIFASGKMCVTGTKSAHNSVLAAKKFCYVIEKVRKDVLQLTKEFIFLYEILHIIL